LVAADIQRAMKYAKNVNVTVVLHEVRDAVVAVQEYTNVTRRGPVSVPNLRKVLDGLGPVVDPLN
jgi:dihydroorotase-like cyclic amidohydrolase